MNNSGILLLDKPKGKTSFFLVSFLRRLSGISKIGHAGTLDPFATGVMIMLIGREYTKLSSHFLKNDKEYLAKIRLGITTDTFDCTGNIISQSFFLPSLAEIEKALLTFQGTILQTPPMFSAKKKEGKKLYELARKGIEISREAIPVTLKTELLSFESPYLELRIQCSKGTYIRSIAHDLGTLLGCGAHVEELVRTRSGPYHLKECHDINVFLQLDCRLNDLLLTHEHCPFPFRDPEISSSLRPHVGSI
jgi:tRNA pseudouridine55 synthase